MSKAFEVHYLRTAVVTPSVYIETTIISYLTARPSRDLIVVAHQQTTSEWWASVRQEVQCFVSPFVIDEAARGDDEYARNCLETVAGFSVLRVNEEVPLSSAILAKTLRGTIH